MATATLIKVMADGNFHSGEDLGQVMSVSRAAVWKQIRKIEGMGLAVESVKGRGYRLVGGVDLLDQDLILAGLSSEAGLLVSELDVRDVVDSTNVQALSRALQGPSSGYVCTAEQQTAGRGRRGKPWLSPYAGSIYLSIVWEFVGGAVALEGLSLATGVVVVESLRRLGLEGVQLKWPNDLLCDGHKLAGILLEMTGDAAGPCQVVVGIGLNVTMSSDLGARIDQPWVDMNTVAGKRQSRNQLLITLLNALLPMLASYESEGFSAYKGRWQKLDAFSEQQVLVSLGREVVSGVAMGVDSTGALKVKTPSGMRHFNGGEVSLRRSDDS
jgi:BirA family biotin operon repressor/biotin-[acetyl-CoA-carboxylase] ligase